MSELPDKIPLIILDSSESPSLFVTHHTKYMDCYDPSKSFSNDFSSAKSCAALVGHSRTPSFTSPVHITSLNSHQSLLSSIDKVFKEIEDFGEDNSVSSLHFFFGNMDLPPSSYHDALEELWDEEEEPEEIETVMKAVPSVYHQSLPPVGVSYSLSNQEPDTLRAYISENVEKGFIRPSSSSTGAPVLFVKKKDGGLHLCVDYRKLNAVTRKNKYPVPPMNQLLNVFNGSSIFSKIYLRGAYSLLRIKEGDEYSTCFRAKYGSSEYLVMPFGLTNAPAAFQNLVNDIFQDLLDVYFVVYLDDIMVFSNCEEEHVTHVSTASRWTKQKSSRFSIGRLQETSKLFNLSLALPISTAVSSRIIQRISVHEEALSQFHQLKEAFTTAPILSHFNPSLPTIVETDASNYALGAVLSQENIPLHSTAASLYQQSSTMRFMTRKSLE
ncbi:hypothetical protein O181_077468 [Austropuccinia psidii MF-1]|uniref:Reverse transcriptase domain-containing protein n=1 Tax=Austropuccinia psidii MF-1 TaxID=1389203 RepID=A0A9Q3FCU9_9BASI|nr:hypothetical protein [Austropuccinia psidii MF-1]